MSVKKTLLVIYPSKGYDCGFSILVGETGEALASHFCSHEGFAMSDLYSGRPERIKEWGERFGEVEVKFLDQTDITPKELVKRNKAWFDSLPENQKK